MKIKSLKIGTSLIAGFLIMVIFVITIGVVSYIQSGELQKQTEMLYEHPLEVRRAVDYLQYNILKMRFETRNLMLAKSKAEQDVAIENIEIAASGFHNEFDIIRSKYLGPQKDVNEAFDAFVAWNVTRQEMIANAKAGDIEKVKEMVKADGAVGKLREEMVKKIAVIDKFASNKSDVIYESSKHLKRDLNFIMVVIVLGMLIIGIVIIYALISQIRKPIYLLSDVANNLSNGNYVVRATNIPDNEFKILSDTFNSLALHLQSEVELRDMESALAEIMLSEDDEQKFFNKLLSALGRFTNSQIAAIYLLNEDKTKLEHYFSIGTDDNARVSFDTQNYEGELGSVLLSKRIQTIKNIPIDTRFIFNTTSGKLVPREILTIPIVLGQEVVAVLSLASIRNYTTISGLLIEKIYDTLNARVVGVLTYSKLKEYTKKLGYISTYNRNLIDANIDPFVVINMDGIITDVNVATENITGLSRDKLIGTDFSQYFARPEKAKESNKQVYSEGFVRNFELYLKHVNGKETPVLFNATLYRDIAENKYGVFASVRDITETKKIENELIKLNDYLLQRTEELKKLNTELEAQKTALSNQSIELAQQNSLLELQKEQLNETNKLKSNFLSNMSHELRTPLNSVIALSGVLHRRLTNKIPDEEYGFITVVERNGKQLLNIINDILDISRIEAGKVEIIEEKFNVNQLISEIISMMKPLADEKNLDLIHKSPAEKLMVISDITKITHILQNLISNALKFTLKGNVIVEASRLNDTVSIKVSDTGIGIAQEHIEYIFDEFRQAESGTARKYGGTGLGLAIAKKYANLLGGEVIVSSNLGEGSVFTLSLPIVQTYSVADEHDHQDDSHPMLETNQDLNVERNSETKARILIIEDSEPAIVQLCDFLAEANFDVLVASGGNEALKILDETMPDAIILDLMMPDIDGFTVLSSIRESVKTENIPVLILTAKHITKEELSFLKKNNIHQLIQKGDINKSDFLQSINKMIQIHPAPGK
jgi:PAS domain S-box-containing protein